MEALWQATVQVIRQAVERFGVAPEHIAGVGLHRPRKGALSLGQGRGPGLPRLPHRPAGRRVWPVDCRRHRQSGPPG